MIARNHPPTQAVIFLRKQGYCVVPNALYAAELAILQPCFCALLEPLATAKPNARHVDAKRLLQAEPAFTALMDHPATLPIIRAVLGTDVTLASGGDTAVQARRFPNLGRP